MAERAPAWTECTDAIAPLRRTRKDNRRLIVVTRPFDEYRASALWTAVEETLQALIATREIAINTAPEYVVGYVCQQLSAKGLVAAHGLEPKP